MKVVLNLKYCDTPEKIGWLMRKEDISARVTSMIEQGIDALKVVRSDGKTVYTIRIKEK